MFCVGLICFPEKNHLTLILFIRGCYIGLLSSNAAIFMDVWDGEKYNFTHSGSPWLWEATMKWVTDSSVKQKDTHWYRCQSVDSLGAICYYMSADDRGGKMLHSGQNCFLRCFCCGIVYHIELIIFAVPVHGTDSKTEQCFPKWKDTEKCNTSSDLLMLCICLPAAFFLSDAISSHSVVI